MRSAPASQVVLGADAGWRWATASCCSAAAAAAGAWCFLWAGVSGPLLLVCAVASAVGGAAASGRCLPAPQGVLAWDGAQWHWRAVPGDVWPAVDLGPWMLLVFRPLGRGGRRSFLPVSRAGARTGWHGLRAAVYCRRPETRTPSAPRM